VKEEKKRSREDKKEDEKKEKEKEELKKKRKKEREKKTGREKKDETKWMRQKKWVSNCDETKSGKCSFGKMCAAHLWSGGSNLDCAS
jgi:hypothetical protein